MAQLKDTLISGSLRVTDTLYTTTAQLAILKAPTASNGTTYGPGTSGYVLKSNGTSVYWGADAQGVTSVTLTSGAGITVSDSGTAITGTGSRTISITGVDTSNGSETQCLTKKGTWKTFGTSNLTIGTTGSTAMAGNTVVNKVKTTVKSDNVNYKLLGSAAGASPTSGSDYEAIYDTNVTVNPSTSTINATTFNGKLTTTRITQPALTGSGTTAVDAGSSDTSTRYRPAVWTFNASITPTDGDIISIKQPCAGHDYGTWLTLDNGSTYYPVVYCSSSRITTHFSNGNAIKLYFDAGGTASVFARGGAMSRTTVTGVWRVMTMYDSNSNDTGYYHRRIYPNLKAGGAIHPYSIIMQLPNGKWSGITTTAPNNPGKSTVSPVATGKAASTSGFMLGHVLLMYANATYADTNNIGTYNIWSAHTGLIDARYSFNLANSSGNGFTAYTPVYIIGTVTNGLFYLDTTKWWTQTLPTTDDGKVYIYIGDAYDWYRITFTEDKPIYWYKNGAVRLYTDTYAASDDGSVISVARNTETTLATINGKTVKIQIPASDNTWRPIGTGASDAMAGNTNVNNVSQGTTTTANWRKILLSGQDYAAYNTAVGSDQNTVTYRAVGVSIQPSTGSMRLSGTITSNHLYNNTNATYDIGATATRWRTAYLSTSLLVGAASTITAYNSNALGSFIGPGVISSCVTAAGNGYYLMGAAGQYARLYIQTIGTTSAGGETYLELGNATATGTAKNSRGRARIYHTNTAYTDYLANGILTNGSISDFTIVGATSNTANTAAWTNLILGNNAPVGTASNAHSQGNLRLYSSGSTYTDIQSQSGSSHTFYLPNYNGNMYAVHVGNNNAVGNIYSPVYIAANGRATEMSPIQYSEWSITTSGHTKCTLTKSGCFTTGTYVLALVVEDGASNLTGPLTCDTTDGTLVITTTAVTGAVSGYVITVRGIESGATSVSSVS